MKGIQTSIQGADGEVDKPEDLSLDVDEPQENLSELKTLRNERPEGAF